MEQDNMRMRSTIKLNNGDELYVQYIYDTNHLMEIKPFYYIKNEDYVYLKDGSYILENGDEMIIKDTIIWRINKKN